MKRLYYRLSLGTLDHQGRFWFRCCLRCEKTEELGVYHQEEEVQP